MRESEILKEAGDIHGGILVKGVIWAKTASIGGGPRKSVPLKGIRLNPFIFFFAKENEPKESALSRLILRVVQPTDVAAPRSAMQRWQACSGAHNLAIAARLASPGALPAGTMLAASAD